MKKKLVFTVLITIFVTSFSVYFAKASPPVPEEPGWEQFHIVTLNGIEYCCKKGDFPWCACVNCITHQEDCP